MVDLTPVSYPDPIIGGSDWDWKFNFVDDDDATAFDWTVDSWQVTLTIKDRNDQVLAVLANYGSPDGTITLQANGLLVANLPGAFTATMPVTRTYINATDPRVAAWRNRGAYVFDLVAVNLTQGYTLTSVSGSVLVQQPVTA